MPAKDIALAVLVQLIWGVGFTSMKPFVAAFPPLLFIAFVYAIIALAVTPLAPRSTTPFRWMMLIAALGGSVQSCLLALGLSLLPASTSTLLLQLTVPFAILMSWIAQQRHSRQRNKAGWVSVSLSPGQLLRRMAVRSQSRVVQAVQSSHSRCRPLQD